MFCEKVHSFQVTRQNPEKISNIFFSLEFWNEHMLKTWIYSTPLGPNTILKKQNYITTCNKIIFIIIIIILSFWSIQQWCQRLLFPIIFKCFTNFLMKHIYLIRLFEIHLQWRLSSKKTRPARIPPLHNDSTINYA